ncbi:MAG TPA: STAS domain-containing protein [Candidatus Acidoferrales bacterium]|nr:STAS domain-containing protein [Candidatus Acidoferrales bacterium]
MQLENTEWQTWTQPPDVAAVELEKELKLKLSLEMRNRGDVIIVHCQGRIVYRDEAAALSRVMGEVLRLGSNVILDLGGVDSMDSAGIGELVLLYTVARERNANLKWANPNGLVRTLLGLTNLDTVLDVHPSVDSALEALGEEQVCADC